MKVVIGGKAVTLSDTDVLGVGGEAVVYKWMDRAVKIYHPPAATLSAQERDAVVQATERKLAKVQSFPGALPPELVAPLDIVTDPRGKPVGFTMPIVAAAEPVLRLTQRKWREGVVANQRVMTLFAKMHDALSRLHGAGVVCGDLNDANVLFRDEDVWLIDADSVQFGSYLCVVAHEKYVDPRLYGRDLTAGPAFDRNTDWYAYAVMLFASLLYVHPYGGIHATLPTMLRRAEARHSVLRPDVTYPKAAVHFRVLPDELVHWLGKVFDQDVREPFPQALLAMRFTKCACGAEHARARCPDCQAIGAAARRDAVVSRGRCRAQRVFATTGRILRAAVQGGLKYVYEQDGVVRREDMTRVMEQPLAPGMRFAISGASTWIGFGDQLVRIEGERPVDRTATGRMGNEPVFDATSATCWRLNDEWLIDHANGTRAGKVLPGQTWFRAGERLGFGFWRAGRHVHHFVFRTDRPGLTDVKLPHVDGRLVEIAVVFDDTHALFMRSVDRNGVVVNAMDLIGADGRVVASVSGSPDSVRILANLGGKALSGGRVLVATEQGLLACRVESGVLVEGTLFEDTEPFVAAGSTILPGPGGSVYVVTTKEITQLTLA